MKRLREWLEWHSVKAHVLAPIWLAIPEKVRWRIVGWLNGSKRFCWSDLVTAALGWGANEGDSCDVHLPNMERTPRCATTCDWAHDDHTGEHTCACYCGKFQFTAAEGSRDRRTPAAVPTEPTTAAAEGAE